MDSVMQRIEAAVRRELGGEYRVLSNRAMGTITVVDGGTSEALQIMDTTGSYLTGGARADDPVVVHLRAA